tara:strand:- start:163 stop:411 length:249 start_codon:yes stop_codon:yes gene_type:complete
MKIKEEELKLIQIQQEDLGKAISQIGGVEATKHGLLHELALLNKDIEDYKEILEKEYGAININLEDGSYTVIETNVEDNKKD